MSCGWSFVQHYERIEPDYKHSLLSMETTLRKHPNPNPERDFSLRKAVNAQNSQLATWGFNYLHSAKGIDS